MASFSFSMRFRSSAAPARPAAEMACWDGGRRKLDRHLRNCPHCSEYLAQLRSTIAAIRRIGAGDVAPEIRIALGGVYRKTLNGQG